MMISFAKGIERCSEHSVRVLTYRSVYGHAYESDIDLSQVEDDQWDQVEQVLREADLFHFHMLLDETYQAGPLLLQDFVKGKQIVHHHHGTYDHQCFLGNFERLQEKYRKNGRTVLAATPDLLEFLPMAHWQPNYVPLEDPLFSPRERMDGDDGFLAVQAPTRTWHKNTREFIAACESCARAHSDFRYEIIRNTSYRECLEKKRSAHLCFDHMQGWYGISSLESLAQGVPVIAGLSPFCQQKMEEFAGVESLPWIHASNEQELTAAMQSLLSDRDRCIAQGIESSRFMAVHWNEEKVIKHLLQFLESRQ